MKYNSKLFIILSLLSMIFFSCEEIPINPNGEGCEEIHGNWVRVRSNNPANDGMELIATGTEGTIIVGRGNFTVGAIKWKDISGSGTNFTHQELGSDGLYYNASMELIGDTINIQVSSSGAGNIQKWVRKEAYTDPGPSAETQTLDCSSFGTAQTLANGPAAVDYIIPSGCVIDVTDALTIEPGTVIHMEANSGIGVYDNGSIYAVGTDAEPIIIKGSDNARGWWRGIHIETVSSNNQLDYVQIENAGSNYIYCCNEVATVFLKGAKISIKNSRIAQGEGMGIYMKGDAELREYENNTITSHTEYPLGLSIEMAGQLDGTASNYTGNDKDFVLLEDITMDDESRLKKLDVPYLSVAEVYDITDKLTIEAGVEWSMVENAGIGVYDQGALKIEGTSGEPVIIRGVTGERGLWRGIHVETNSISNDINYLQLSNAGSNYVYCCNEKASLFLKDGALSIRNSTISDGAEYGIVANADFSFTAFEGNTITNHDKAPVLTSGENAGFMGGNSSDFTGNNRDFIEMLNSNIATPTRLQKPNVPYYISAFVLDVTKPLTIDPGVEMVFGENGGIGVYDEGTLNAVGTATDKIIFRGSVTQKGQWRGIHTETLSNNNELTHVELTDSGGNYVYCCNSAAALFVKAGRMKVTNSYIHDNDGCGIFVKAGATLEETGNTFAGNADGHICN